MRSIPGTLAVARLRFSPRRPTRPRLAPLLITAVLVGLVGCGSIKPRLGFGELGRYDGPPIRAEPVGRTYQLVLMAPTPGWEFELDGSRPGFNRQDVAVTVRRPNPEFFPAQVLVEMRLATEVPVEHEIRVYARELEFDQQPRGTYRRAELARDDPPATDTDADIDTDSGTDNNGG